VSVELPPQARRPDRNRTTRIDHAAERPAYDVPGFVPDPIAPLPKVICDDSYIV
jgi:hypothetical protein